MKYRLFALLALALLACLLAPTSAYAQDMPLTFFQKADENDRVVTYRMTAVDTGAPMPRGAKDGIYEWQMTGDETVTLHVDFNTPQDVPERAWRYTFVQMPSDELDVIYDDTSYEVTVHTYAEPFYSGGEQHELLATIEDSDGEKVWDPGWIVSVSSLAEETGSIDDPIDDEKADTIPSDTPTVHQASDTGNTTTVKSSESRMPKTSDLFAGIGMVALALAGCGLFLVIAGVSQRRSGKRDE